MLKFDERGLIPAIAQDHLTGQVRMLAYMNQAALEQTLESGKATFFSRSRGALWTKGETSGNRLQIVSLATDCDQDTILARVNVEGGGVVCHEGTRSCFTRALEFSSAPADEIVAGGAR